MDSDCEEHDVFRGLYGDEMHGRARVSREGVLDRLVHRDFFRAFPDDFDDTDIS